MEFKDKYSERMPSMQVKKMESGKKEQLDWIRIITELNKKKEKNKSSQSQANETNNSD